MKKNLVANLKNDLPAGIVVFLVAVPLCLGIALASGAPFFSGMISGIVGGIIVGLLSNSQMSVSGPAAGLTAVVIVSIAQLGTFETFLLAVVIAGVLQVVLGIIKAGAVANYIPSSVIKGMLTAIGIIIIMKQIPHAFGYDKDAEGSLSFLQADGENTFSALINVLSRIDLGATIICLVSLAILILWEKPFFKKKLRLLPGGLVAVGIAIVMNEILSKNGSSLVISGQQLVNVPVAQNFQYIPRYHTVLVNDVAKRAQNVRN